LSDLIHVYNIKGIEMFDNVEKMSPEAMLSELRRWHFCYRDDPDNFDARLIKCSIQIIEELLDKIESDGKIDEGTA
jgi:hypothetical protein